MSDEKWILSPPKSKYLEDVNHSDEQSSIDENNLIAGSVDEQDMKSMISSSLGNFVDELNSSGDIERNPISWLISLVIIAPGFIIGLKGIENGESFASYVSLNNEIISSLTIILFDFLIIGQLIIGPGASTIFAKNRNLGPAVFVAMGSSAVLMINHDVIVALAQNNDIFAVLTCIGCLSPLVMILRKKRKQLPAGRARHTWAFLMSVSILMFASASLVVALQNSSTLEISDEMAWSSLLVVAGAIGWAWPKGRHIIEEVADEIIDVAV